jgi:hypothetical protein
VPVGTIRLMDCPVLCGRMAGVSRCARGQVAQLVEQRTENPRVGGSIPPLAIEREVLKTTRYRNGGHLMMAAVSAFFARNSPELEERHELRIAEVPGRS